MSRSLIDASSPAASGGIAGAATLPPEAVSHRAVAVAGPWGGALQRGWRRAATLLRPTLVFLGADGSAALSPGQAKQAALDSFAQWCREHAGSDCEIALSSRLFHLCMPPVEAGRLKAAELRLYAQRQFEHYFGGPQAQDWAIAVSSHAQAPLACGMPRSLLRSLQEVAALHGVRIRRVLPWWARGVPAALAQACQEQAGQINDSGLALVALEPHAATVFWLADARLTRVWIEVAAAQRLDAQWRARLPASAVARVLPLPAAGPAPAARLARQTWADELDLLGQHVRVWPGAWALLALGVVAVAGLSDQYTEQQEAQARAQAQLTRLERVAHAQQWQAQVANQAAAAAAERLPEPDGPILQQAVRLSEQLAHPWPQLLGAVESAAKGVALLQFDHDAGSRSLRLEAAVRDDAAAWRFVQTLAAHPQFAQAVLEERGLLSPPMGEFGLRVRVLLTLAPAGQP